MTLKWKQQWPEELLNCDKKEKKGNEEKGLSQTRRVEFEQSAGVMMALEMIGMSFQGRCRGNEGQLDAEALHLASTKMGGGKGGIVAGFRRMMTLDGHLFHAVRDDWDSVRVDLAISELAFPFPFKRILSQ